MPDDVSKIVSTVAINEGCPFAIKGAGHAPQAGAANIVSSVFKAIIPEHKLQVKFWEDSFFFRTIILQPKPY